MEDYIFVWWNFLSFYNTSFFIKILFNVNGKATMWPLTHPLFFFFILQIFFIGYSDPGVSTYIYIEGIDNGARIVFFLSGYLWGSLTNTLAITQVSTKHLIKVLGSLKFVIWFLTKYPILIRSFQFFELETKWNKSL